MNLVHAPTFRLNSILFAGIALLSVVLWIGMPERYPVHFDLAGNPTRWEERGIGMWVLVTALFTISFLQMHLFQRYLITDPDSPLLNVPYKELFRQLPTERKVRVIRRTNRFLGLMNTGVLAIWGLLLISMRVGAEAPGSPVALLTHYAVLAVVVLLLAVPIFEIVALRRMIRAKLKDEGLLEEWA